VLCLLFTVGQVEGEKQVSSMSDLFSWVSGDDPFMQNEGTIKLTTQTYQCGSGSPAAHCEISPLFGMLKVMKSGTIKCADFTTTINLSECVIDAKSQMRVMDAHDISHGTLTLQALTLTNGAPHAKESTQTFGGGLRIYQSMVNVNICKFVSNSAEYGSGIRIYGSETSRTVNVYGTTFSGGTHPTPTETHYDIYDTSDADLLIHYSCMSGFGDATQGRF